MPLSREAQAEVERKKRTVDQAVLDPNIFIKDFPLDPWTPYLVTNRFIQQTVSRMLGYSPTDLKWVRLNVDEDGKLEVSGITTLEASHTNWYNGTSWVNWEGPSGEAPWINKYGNNSSTNLVFNDVGLVASGTLTHIGLDISAYSRSTILLSTTGDCTLYIQFSDDNTNWYDWCDSSGTAISFGVNNVKKAFDINVASKYMRIVVYNSSGSTVTVRGSIVLGA